jgi:hypothetical protein
LIAGVLAAFLAVVLVLFFVVKHRQREREDCAVIKRAHKGDMVLNPAITKSLGQFSAGGAPSEGGNFQAHINSYLEPALASDDTIGIGGAPVYAGVANMDAEYGDVDDQTASTVRSGMTPAHALVHKRGALPVGSAPNYEVPGADGVHYDVPLDLLNGAEYGALPVGSAPNYEVPGADGVHYDVPLDLLNGAEYGALPVGSAPNYEVPGADGGHHDVPSNDYRALPASNMPNYEVAAGDGVNYDVALSEAPNYAEPSALMGEKGVCSTGTTDVGNKSAIAFSPNLRSRVSRSGGAGLFVHDQAAAAAESSTDTYDLVVPSAHNVGNGDEFLYAVAAGLDDEGVPVELEKGAFGTVTSIEYC